MLEIKTRKLRGQKLLNLATAAALLFTCVVLGCCPVYSTVNGSFVVRPYIQLGNNPTYGATDNLALMWISQQGSANWKVELKRVGEKEWKNSPNLKHRQILDTRQHEAHFVFECALKDLPVNKPFSYRVLQDGVPVFESSSQARKSKDQPYRFDVFGDMGADTEEQRKIGSLSYRLKPDLIVFPGDLVYSSGLYHQYLKNYFPIYNSDLNEPAHGVPLLRNVLTIGLVGNHDVATDGRYLPADFNQNPDALAYFYLWSLPINGPAQAQIRSSSMPPMVGSLDRQESFKKSAAEHFPSMCNFSFDYANSHWLVLDGNYYTHWADPAMRKWVEADLQKAQTATWRFVTFHQPGFTMDVVHSTEQRMRMLSDIFQKKHVDIVFSGHAHDYQRTHPITFTPKLKDGRPFMNSDDTVDGTIALDKKFDGTRVTQTNGVIYVVTGAGGATLYSAIPEARHDVKFDFIDKFDSRSYSLSACEVNGRQFKMKQMGENGEVIDRFTLTK